MSMKCIKNCGRNVQNGGKHTDIQNDNEISWDSELNYKNGVNLTVLSSAIYDIYCIFQI